MTYAIITITYLIFFIVSSFTNYIILEPHEAISSSIILGSLVIATAIKQSSKEN